MKSKNLISILLCFALLLTLSACSGGGGDSSSLSCGSESSSQSQSEKSELVAYTKQMEYAVSAFGSALKNQADLSEVVPTMELLLSAAQYENENGTDKAALEKKYAGKAVILASSVEAVVKAACGPDTTVRHSQPADYDKLDVNYYAEDHAYVLTATGAPSAYVPYFLRCDQTGDTITAKVILIRFEQEDLETFAYYDENGLKLGTVADNGTERPLDEITVASISQLLPQRIYTFKMQDGNYYLRSVKTV